ncbi:MAG: CPBP family intramembrane glutamic endopeptidase [Erythrobacter sp.]
MTNHPGEDMAEIPLGKMLSLVVTQATVFVAIGLGLWFLSDRELTDFVTVDARQIAIGLGIAGAMIAAGYVLFRGFPKFGEGLVRDQAQQFAFLEKRLGLGAITLLAACAGIGEEALFRGGLLVFGAEYTPFIVALIASSAIFTIIHFAKPKVAAFIFGIGMMFGVIYWSTGSLLAVMIGHWVYDIWALWFIQEEMHRFGVFEPDNDAIEKPTDLPS